VGISGAVGDTAAQSMKKSVVNTEMATQKASGLSTALGGIGGILTSIGLGVGISLLTSHLASSAEQANKTKREIAELASISLDFRTARTGAERC
jgi:hypothetical protein